MASTRQKAIDIISQYLQTDDDAEAIVMLLEDEGIHLLTTTEINTAVANALIS